jgi:N utilization substance protein A
MELLTISQAVAQEKNLDYDVVLKNAIAALEKAARNHYGRENDIRIEIDKKTQELRIFRYREVMADDTLIENEHYQIHLKDARRENKTIEVGEFLIDELPMVTFSRADAQTVKQSFNQGIREADREKQFEEFKDREGEIVYGVVKREEYGNLTIDIGGKGEAMLRRDETLPRERYKMGDRVRAYIYRVSREVRGPQIFVSRTHPQFMAKLFTAEVPEIYDGIIEIKAVARDPGSRAKFAVISNDSSIDPVGACVGMRGSRVQAVVNELGGEKVDIIPWSEDPATFVVNALAPAEVAKIVLDEDEGRLEVVVPDDQLSLAIGRRGQNVRLASMLTGWDIDILTEAEESERRAKETKERTELFTAVLDVDDVIAHLLVAEGFTNIEEVAYIETSELAAIEGFDEGVASELQQRAKTWLEKRDTEREATMKKLGIADDLRAFDGITFEMLEALGNNGVKTLDDFADLASDELIEYVGKDKIKPSAANEMIMRARAGWFAEEDAASEEQADA